MKPKEKAKELCLKFQHKLFINISDKEENANYVHNDSKQCAMIAVDEIIETTIDDWSHSEYWQEVKREIQNL